MERHAKIAFIGAGSTVFAKNILGDILHNDTFKSAHFALMDIDENRLKESEIVINKVAQTLNATPSITTHLNQKQALDGADFVIVAFQIGGYEPCTVSDFEIPKQYGLRQTIADTLGIGGIMRGLRTIPHLWQICEDMLEVCPNALMLNYVNPMAINTWAIYAKYPQIKQVGLCHSVQGTAEELAKDLDIDVNDIQYKCAGINHVAFYLNFQRKLPSGELIDLYPILLEKYNSGELPKKTDSRCQNIVRYEMLKRLGYFVTESSEHFAEYTPWFIKSNREDLIAKFKVPLDEYPKRCVEQIESWQQQAQEYTDAKTIEVKKSHEYASLIINSVWTGEPSVIYGSVRNDDLITNLPHGCAVEVPCLVDSNGISPTYIGDIPTHLAALMRTNINVQELVVDSIVKENKASVYHAAMMDPHTAAELDIEQIWNMVDEMLIAHKDWLPAYLK